MTLVVTTLLGLWSLLLAAHGTPVGRFLNTWMVEAPARRLSRVYRGHIVLALALAAASAFLLWFLEGEGIRLLAMSAPEIGTWVAAFEVTTYLDVVIALGAASSMLRVRSLAAFVAARTPSRAPRPRRVRPQRKAPANDDEDGGRALAA